MAEPECGAMERMSLIDSKENYAYVTRSLLRLFKEGRLTNVKDVIVEPDYGYVTMIEYTDGSHRVTYGNDLGLNPGSSEDLAKDKGHTKSMLRAMGIACPRGKDFLLPWWHERIKLSQEQRGKVDMSTIDQADAYITSDIGYPVYVKPVDGSKGGGVYRVEDEAELLGVFEEYEKNKTRVAVVEEAVDMPDYRVVILDGQLISAYQRIPLAVTGNGVDSTEVLINKLSVEYHLSGRDTVLDAHEPRVTKHLGKIGLNVNYVPGAGENVTLVPISNLSAGGTSLDVTAEIAPKWVELSVTIAEHFNLRLCGIDLACNDITSGSSEYSVLEVNAAPGLDHYASSGEEQRRIVDDLYTKVLNVSPLRAPNEQWPNLTS